MLYDCRSDSLIPALTLWDLDTLKSAMNRHKQPYTNYELIAEDSLSEKTLKLGVDASLKLSFLSGMVKVGGSAHYLNDRKKSTKQERVTLKYSTISHNDALSMDHLGPGDIQHPQIFEKGDATHVVLGVEYGNDAIFIFDRDVGFNEIINEDNESLGVAMNLFIREIEGAEKVSMSEGQKNVCEKIHCTFYGDLELNKSPSNFIEAMGLYHDLPDIIKKCGPVPKKAWLYPLEKLDSKAARLVREISLSLVNQTEMLLENLHEAEMNAADIWKLCHPIFANQRHQVENFRRSLIEFKNGFQKKLVPLLPQIRGGVMEEERLAELIEGLLRSPFNPENVKLWLDGKKYEVEMLNHFFQQLQEKLHNYEVLIALTRSEADKMLNNIDYEAVVGFAFNISMKSDPFLDDLHDYLRKNPRDVADCIKPQFLHQDQSVRLRMRKNMNAFLKFISLNCKNKNGSLEKFFEDVKKEDMKKTKYMVYADDKDVGNQYARIVLHNLVKGTETDFTPPSAPGRPHVEEQNPGVLTWTKLEEGFEHVNYYELQYMICKNRADDEKEEWDKTEHKKCDLNYIDISDLKINGTYIFRVCGVSPGGVGEFSEPAIIALRSEERDRLIVDIIRNCESMNKLTGYFYTEAHVVCLMKSLTVLAYSGPDSSLVTMEKLESSFKFLEYPTSFTASTHQLLTEISAAFHHENIAMEAIKALLYSVINKFVDLSKFFGQLEVFESSEGGSSTKIATILEEITALSEKCIRVSDDVNSKFEHVLKVFDELLYQVHQLSSTLRDSRKILENSKIKFDELEVKLRIIVHFFGKIKIIIKEDIIGHIERFKEALKIKQMISMRREALISIAFCVQVSNVLELYVLISDKFVIPDLGNAVAKLVLTPEKAKQQLKELKENYDKEEVLIKQMVAEKQKDYHDRTREQIEGFSDKMNQAYARNSI
uniref:Fibronectin type-III domain-containing protein n=1 Tax=Acrobeloides nanus TaxID=290746 RepID=A0A914DTV9_9BILA